MKIIMGLLLLAAFAFGDDHGDTINAATPIELNSTTAGNIETGGDVDFFNITLPTSGKLEIYTTGNTDTYGYLLDSAGRAIAANDDSGLDYNLRIVSNSITAGTYYIKVRHYSAWRSGRYTLHVEFTADITPPTDDHGDTTNAATTVGPNSTTAGNIETGGDIDFFKVVLPTSGKLEIYTTGNTDTYGYLLDSASGVITSNDDSGSDYNFKIVSNSITAGTYYIKVRHYSPKRVGRYTLRIHFASSAVPVLQDDHGNSKDTATTVEPNSTTAGNIEVGGDFDFFKIVLPTSGTLTINTTGNTDTFGYLFNSTSSMLSANDDSGLGYNFRISRLLAAGTYYVKVRHYYSSRTGSYALNVEFVANSEPQGTSVDTAISIGFNSITDITMSPDEDARYYKFEIPQDRTGRVVVYSTGSAKPIGYLYDSEHVMLTYNNSFIGFRINRIIGGGVYYIKLTQGLGIDRYYRLQRGGEFQLHVEFTPDSN